MKTVLGKAYPVIGLLISAFLLPTVLHADKNQVMGEIRLEGKTEADKTSGVWVDKEYVGYLKELKGSKKILLLPGEHLISVRQDGYQEFTDRVVVRPGQTEVINVSMVKVATPPMPAVLAEIKLAVTPSRAAVFVDELYVGHVKEFQGMGKGLLVAPGKRHISIALPGYQAFETTVEPQPNQKVEIKTDLLPSSGAPVGGPLVTKGAGDTPVGSPDLGRVQTH